MSPFNPELTVPAPESEKRKLSYKDLWLGEKKRYDGTDPKERPTDQDILKQKERMVALPRRDLSERGRWTGTYDDVLREIVAVATKDYAAGYAGGWLYHSYRGWQQADFQKLLDLLDEQSIDINPYVVQGKALARQAKEIGPEELFYGAVHPLADQYCPAPYRQEIYAKLRAKLKEDPAFMDTLTNLIDEWSKSSGVDYGDFRDELKQDLSSKEA